MKDAAKKFRKTCEKCNKPFSTANESEVLCRECRMRDDFAKRRAEDEARKEADAKSNEVFETRKCVDCGHEFDITNRDRDFFESHGYSLPNRCPECRKIHRDFVKGGLDNIGLEDTCADCGQKLQFTNRELYWYVVHDYKLPTRCKACREKRNEHFAKIAAKKVTADGVKDAVIEAPVNESVAEDANVPAITGDITSPAETVTETPVEAAAETVAETASNTTPDANGVSA